MKKSLFLTFCFSFVPGAGQMYQMYTKRGISILSIFSFFIALGIIVGSAIFVIPAVIIYIYSFFDTFNIRNCIDREDLKIKDDYIWAGTDYDLFSKMDNNPFVKKRGIWIGIMLLTFGIYLIVNNVLHNVALNYDIEWLMVFTNLIIRYLPSIFISILSIAVGIKFIIKK